MASSWARSVGVGIVDRFDIDVQGAFVADGATADSGPAQAADHEREGAIGQLACVLDLGDRADLREHVVDLGHEYEPAAGLLGGGTGALGLIGLERDRDDHLREDNALRQGQDGKLLRPRRGFVRFELSCVLVGHLGPTLLWVFGIGVGVSLN